MAEQKAYRLLSVIVPVFNEHNTVGEIVRRTRHVELPIDREIVVVNDGSTDGTDRILAVLEDSTVRVLHHADNRGKAASIRTGIEAARGELLLIQDADLEYDPEDWPALLAPVLKGKAQVVYGSRFLGERQTARYFSSFGARFLTTVTQILYNTNLSDVETGYKLFDRAVLDGITIESEGFDFEPEITAKLLRRGHRIYEVPISFAMRSRNEGMKFTRRDTARAVRTLLKYRFRRAM